MLTACGAAHRGIEPGAAAPVPRVTTVGVLRGWALGWALGGEVHVAVADSGVATAVYEGLARHALTDAPATFAAATAHRALIAVAAAELPLRRAGAPDAVILHAGGGTGALLELVRLHRAGACGAALPVVELVYRFPAGATGPVPPPHAPVLAALREPLPRADAAGGGAAGRQPPRAHAARLAATVALAAESLAARAAGEVPGAPLAGRLALDPESAVDAADVIALTHDGRRHAVAVRVRFLAPTGDTTLVTAVAVTDSGGRDLSWIITPRRFALAAPPADAARHGLRGTVGGALGIVLVREVAEVAAAGSRLLAVAVAPDRTPRVLAAQPLALRCP